MRSIKWVIYISLLTMAALIVPVFLATPVSAQAPSAPTITSATPSDSQVILDWTAPSDPGDGNITNYNVYRGTTHLGETFLTTLGIVLTYTDTGLTNGQTYWYQVSAVSDTEGEGAKSIEASATPTAPATVPSAPSLDSATSGNAQVVLGWTAQGDGGSAIINYKIYRGPTSGSETLLDTVGDVPTSYTDSSVINGQTYWYKVSAINSVGESLKSNELSAKPIGPPSAPRNFQASPGNAFINLSWQGPTSDGGSAVTNYQVWRGDSSGTETFLADAGLNLWFNNTGLTNNQTYYYIIKAENAQGLGPSSNEVSTMPSQVVTVPTAPQSLTATAGNGQVVLTWSMPTNNGGAAVTNYTVYRSTTSGGETLLITLGNVLNYINTGLTNGVTFYYKVTAVNGVGESTLSNEAYTTPATAPSAPTLISVTPGNGQVVLVWTAPSSNGSSTITNYKVWRGVTSGSEVEIQQVGIVLTWTDTNVTNGLIYYYQIQAVNAIAPGALSNEISAKPIGAPTAPQSLQASPGNAFINLSWQGPTSDGGNPITNYKVWRGNSSGTETFLANTGLNLWFNDTGLTNGQTYYYKVSAENAVLLGPNSSEVFATSGQEAALPSAPRDLAADPGNANVTLTWSVPSNDHGSPITYCKIYRGTTPNGEVVIAMLGNVLAYTDTYVTIGQIYYYKVSAVNDVGEGPQSNEAFALIGVPDTPWGLKVIWGNEQAALSWNAVNYSGPGILNYHLFRDGTPIWNGTVTSHLDTGLNNGAVYYYIVAASNDVGWSMNSSRVSATPQGPPTAPMGLHAEAGNGSVELNWTAPTYVGIGTTEYHLFRNGTLIWSGTELEYIDSGLMTSVTYSYHVVAENSIGWGPNSTAVDAIPLSGGNQPSTPWTPIATAGFAAIGAMPLIVISYKMILYRRKVAR